MSYIIVWENKTTDNKKMLLALKNNADAGYRIRVQLK